MKQIIGITLLSLVATILANPTGDAATPEECLAGTPKYDKEACKETCAKEPHIKQPYCEDINQAASIVTTPLVPAAPEVGADGIKSETPVASPAITTEAEILTINPNVLATLRISNDGDGDDDPRGTHLTSNGISIQSSILFSVLSLFFTFFYKLI